MSVNILSINKLSDKPVKPIVRKVLNLNKKTNVILSSIVQRTTNILITQQLLFLLFINYKIPIAKQTLETIKLYKTFDIV